MKNIRDKLARCQVFLEEGDYDSMIETLKEISESDFSNLSLEEAKELMNLLNFLVEKTEAKRQELAQNLVNFSRFREYLR
jgi:hypothetical protein